MAGLQNQEKVINQQLKVLMEINLLIKVSNQDNKDRVIQEQALDSLL